MTEIATIKSVTIEHQYRIEMPDGLLYSVLRRETKRGTEWIVEGGGFRRSHRCEPDGRTYKRVVAAVQAALNQDKAKNLALALNPF